MTRDIIFASVARHEINVQPDHIGIVSVFDGARNPAALRRRLK
jgi:hypothetical protein